MVSASFFGKVAFPSPFLAVPESTKEFPIFNQYRRDLKAESPAVSSEGLQWALQLSNPGSPIIINWEGERGKVGEKCCDLKCIFPKEIRVIESSARVPNSGTVLEGKKVKQWYV